MQNIIIPTKVNGIKGTIVELPSGEESRSDTPAITKNLACTIRLRLMQSDGTTKYDPTQLADIISWYFIMANDWNPATGAQIKTITNIYLDATESYTDIVIVLSAGDTNTSELIAALLTQESTSLKVEVGGYEAEHTEADFVLQLNGIVVRNRLETTEDPTSLPETYLTAVETYALVAAAPVFEFSVDGATLWHSTQAAEDRYYREQRNGGEWSEAIALINNSDFSGFDTKTELVDGDTAIFNNSLDSGNAIVITCLKIWNYIISKLFPGSMTVGNLVKYGTGGILEDAGLDPDDILVDTDKGSLTEDTSNVLTVSGGTDSTLGNVTIQVKAAGTAQDGYLSSADWNTFNGKQDALGFTPANSALTVNGYALTSNITLDADDLADGATNAVITLTQETNFETAYTHSQATTGNPHSVSKSDVGLGNVPNTDCTNADNITTGTLPPSVIPDIAITVNVCFVTSPSYDTTLDCVVFPLDDVNAALKTDRMPSISNLKANIVSANSSFTGNIVIYTSTGRTALTQAGWTASTGVSGAYYRSTAPGTEPTFTTEDTSLLKKVADTASLVAGSWCWDDGDTLGYDTLYVYPNTGNTPTTDGDGFYQYDITASQTIAVGATEAEKTITISSASPVNIELWRDTYDTNDTLVDGSSVPVSAYFTTLEYKK